MSIVTSSYSHQVHSAANNSPYNIATHSFPNSNTFKMEAYNASVQSNTDYPYPQPSTPPRTPKKSGYGPTTSAVPVLESAPKPRTKGKNRSKNAVKSPVVSGNERKQSTPKKHQVSSARPISTPSAPAFAGPTFHASPAPSALPLPSFFSKSIPDSPGLQNIKAGRGESSSSGSESSTPPSTKAVVQTNREESPLDIFFRADRAEKARARSTSSIGNSATGPFQPPTESPHNAYGTPTGGSSRHRPADGVFAMDFDGNNSPSTPYGPAFSTPYHERIRAARSTSSPHSPQQSFQNVQNTQPSKSDALKAYLFSQQPSSTQQNDSVDAPKSFSPLPPRANAAFRNPALSGNSPSNCNMPPRGHPNHNLYLSNPAAAQNSPLGQRSSGLCREVEITPTKSNTDSPQRPEPYYAAPGTPSRAARDNSSSLPHDFSKPISSYGSSQSFAPASGRSSENTDLRGMEDSLRRLLKLDTSGTLAAL